MKTAIISVPAFMNLVISSIEVYKKEAYGVIIGSKTKKEYRIDYAINFQSANRHYEYIEMDVTRINRINSILKYLVKKKVVGDFHSHADRVERFSEHDLKELVSEGPGYLGMLVSVTTSTQSKKWKYRQKHQKVSGSLGKFYVTILAQEYDPKKKKIVPVKIRLKNIKDLNKISKYYEVLWEKLEKYHKEEIKAKKRKQTLKKKLRM